MKHVLLLLMSCALAGSGVGIADQLPDMERTVLPVTVTDRPGAFGTRWSSRLQIYIDVDPVPPEAVIPLVPAGCDIFGFCEPVVHTSRLFMTAILPTGPNDSDGQFLYIQRSIVANVSLSLKLAATHTGDGGSDVVDIPVVRERDFRSVAFSIMDVPPPSNDRRLALRIYGHDPSPGGVVRVRILQGFPERIVRDDVYTLNVAQRYLTNVLFMLPLRPPVAEAFYSAPFDSSGDTLRFEITPLTPGLLAWSFVSATDNTTQRVTIFAPN